MKNQRLTKLEVITKNVINNKELQKGFKKYDNNYYQVDDFIRDAKAYIKAIKDNRMINSIKSVSSSGMSRNMKFLSCEKNKNSNRHNYRTYYAMFKVLGHSESRSLNGYFLISGCGMDMVFHTNYTIIHRLQRLGFISKDECSILCQMTPTTI